MFTCWELWCVIYCLVSCLIWVAIQLVGYLVASGCLLVGCVALFLLIVVWLNSVVFIGSFVLVFVAWFVLLRLIPIVHIACWLIVLR